MQLSRKITIFHERLAPEEGVLVGYGAMIEAYQLAMPLPETLSLISSKKRQYHVEGWSVYTSRHLPDDTLYKQLTFAIRYEGINLLFFKKLFDQLNKTQVKHIVQIEPLGQYSRKIWFLYEWLMQEELDIKSLKTGNYVQILDAKLQYCITNSKRSPRHRIVNNLPGTVNFCPLIKKTEKLEHYIAQNIQREKTDTLKGFKKDLLQRTAAFLLLKDSKASFTIEGESPKNKRTARWGKIIGQAGTKTLNKDELLRLQQEVIENTRFVAMGYRKKGGFVGEHNRTTGEPIPEHISANWRDIEILMQGLIDTTKLLSEDNIDAVIAATAVAFGFVFIHPFEDGNGRIHRYLIHHLLTEKNFTQQGIIFPVSTSILDHIVDYRKVLEHYSHSILDFIDWKETKGHNIEVLNETIDFYRYFDATKQAEFLYDSVNDTIENIIPQEINYLQKYDEFKRVIEEIYEMPDSMIASLVRFLEQNEGKLSKRAKEHEFAKLNKTEVDIIEQNYKLIMSPFRKGEIG